ncbi:MAG TPA: hypothetical protein VFO83_06095 [Aggregicoccus sp.]|nr:hypothetical protein [Aggregicoccus sp.]
MSELVTAASLKEFFKSLLEDVIRRRQMQITDVTEFYLVNLLSDFVSSDKLFDQELGGQGEGKRDHEPLALLYARALSQEREARIRTLRRLGDVSLYKAGFFADALRDGPVGADYYIQMGGAAYGQVASLSAGAGFSAVYRELCAKFRVVVEVLEEIAARGLVANGPTGVMKVFESWARTGNDRLEQVLLEAGMALPKGGGPLN